jgi:AcrR family transcriptional regulator
VPERKRLSAQDWVGAAVEALLAGGVAAVAVEPLAARLGTTKGSFYWHFANRDALLEAALRQWERTDTEEVIALVGDEPDPRARLLRLLTVAVGGSGGRVELALLAGAEHPVVAPVLARVTERRLGYLEHLFAELGLPAPEARRRALLGYTAYLGQAQLSRAARSAVPTGEALAAYIESTSSLLTARPLAAGPDVEGSGPETASRKSGSRNVAAGTRDRRAREGRAGLAGDGDRPGPGAR